MKKATKYRVVAGSIAVFTGIFALNTMAAEITFEAKYDVWISPNHHGGPVAPPYNPYHDCLHVNGYDDGTWNLLLERCPPAGPAWVNPGSIQAFGGRTCDRHLLGWYINSAAFPWAGHDTVGGVMGSKESQHSWGFEGVRNDECRP